MNIEIENYMKTLKVDEICRTCLSECDEMISLFTEVESTDEDISFVYQIIMNVSSTEIFMNDGLPTLICKNCVESANNSFKFKVLCERSAVLLHTYFTNVSNKINDPEKIIVHPNEEVVENDNLESSTPMDSDEKLQNCVTSNEMLIVINDSKLDESLASTKPKQTSNKQEEDLNNILVNSIVENYEIFKVCESNLSIPEIIVKSDIRTDNNKTEMREGSCSKEFSDAIIVAAKEENIRLRERIKLKRMSSQSKMHNKRRTIYKCLTDANGKKLFCCTMCDKKYKHSTSLTVHIRTHTMENPYLCMYCGKRFKHFTGYRYHIQAHNNELPYKCNLCDKKYRQSASLTVHMRSHTGQRPFLCSVCGKGFRQQPDLGYHMRTHTKEKPYMCNVCGKTMSMQCHLVQHMRTHTGEKPFKCNTCNKAFPSSTRLKRHEIIHTGQKPHVCQVCNKAFNRESTLKVHTLTHSDVRPHVCHHCGKGFIQLHCLRNHIKTHITQKDFTQSE